MTKWIVSACYLALAAAPAAAADVRLDSYRNPKNENFRIFNHMYLDGVRGGMMAYNAWLAHHGGQPSFCMPGNLALTTEQTEEIMLKSADKRGAKGDMLVASLLLWECRTPSPAKNRPANSRAVRTTPDQIEHRFKQATSARLPRSARKARIRPLWPDINAAECTLRALAQTPEWECNSVKHAAPAMPRSRNG